MSRLTLTLAVAILCTAGLASAQAPLTPAQQEAMKKVLLSGEADGRKRLAAITEKITDIAKQLDRNALADKPDAALDKKLREELTASVIESVKISMDLRLTTIWELAKVLNADQKKYLLTEIDMPGTNPDLADLIQRRFAVGAK